MQNTYVNKIINQSFNYPYFILYDDNLLGGKQPFFFRSSKEEKKISLNFNGVKPIFPWQFWIIPLPNSKDGLVPPVLNIDKSPNIKYRLVPQQ